MKTLSRHYEVTMSNQQRSIFWSLVLTDRGADGRFQSDAPLTSRSETACTSRSNPRAVTLDIHYPVHCVSCTIGSSASPDVCSDLQSAPQVSVARSVAFPRTLPGNFGFRDKAFERHRAVESKYKDLYGDYAVSTMMCRDRIVYMGLRISYTKAKLVQHDISLDTETSVVKLYC